MSIIPGRGFGNQTAGMFILAVLTAIILSFAVIVKSVMCLGDDGFISLKYSFNGTCRPAAVLDAGRTGDNPVEVRTLQPDVQPCGRCLDVEMDSTVIVPSRQPEQMTLRAEGPGAGDLLPGESPSGAGTPVRIAGPSRMGCGPDLPEVPQHSPILLL